MSIFWNKLTRIRKGPVATVGGAALVLAVFGIASRILGLIRDRILASMFGAGDTLDVYYAAFRIPDILFSLLVLGAISAAFIPIFTKVLEQDSKERANALATSVLILLAIFIGVLGLLGAMFMPQLAHLIAPGFDVAKQESVAHLARIMFLSPLFFGVSAVFGGVLVSKRCFWAYSIAPLFYNLGIIFGAVVLVKVFGISGLAWGVALGAAMHMVVQFLSARKQGFSFVFDAAHIWQDPDVRSVVRLMAPRTMAAAVSELNLFVITVFASTLAVGSLAVFNLANNLQSIPLALFGVSFATAAFPRLSSLSAKKQYEELVSVFMRTLRRILFFVVPATALMLVLRAQIVRVVLGSGRFNWEDTVLTFGVFGLLAASLFAQSLLPLCTRTFYSLHDTKTPFFIALFAAAANIALAAYLIGPYGVYGLAMAFSLASIMQMALLVGFLQWRLRDLFLDTSLFLFLAKLIGASLFAVFVTQMTKSFWGTVTNLSTFWEVFIQFLFSGTIGIMSFLAAAMYLKIDEFFDLKKKMLLRVFGITRTYTDRGLGEADMEK